MSYRSLKGYTTDRTLGSFPGPTSTMPYRLICKGRGRSTGGGGGGVSSWTVDKHTTCLSQTAVSGVIGQVLATHPSTVSHIHARTHTQHQYYRSSTGWDSGPPNPSPPLTPWMGQWSTQPLSTPHPMDGTVVPPTPLHPSPHGWDSGPPNPSPPLTPWMGQWSTQPLSTPHPMDGTVVHPTPLHPSPHGWDSGPPNPSPPLTPWMGQWSTQPLSTPYPMDGTVVHPTPLHPSPHGWPPRLATPHSST